MFQPPIFREDRADVMREHSFATIVLSATRRLSVDHVPLVLHDEAGEKGALRGQLAVPRD